MTYCAGWKYQGSIYLIADTAVTKQAKPNKNYSSFGQLHSNTQEGYVEESLLKLVPLSQGIAVAYAGNVGIASEILNLLKENSSYINSVKDLTRLADGMGPFDPTRRVEILIASSSTDGNNELIKWDTINGIDKSEANFYQIGSLTSFHAAVTPYLLNNLSLGNLAADRVLPVITSVVQSYGVHDNLIQMNVGGVIFGLCISNGKVRWQEDTNYFLYSPNFQPSYFISVVTRDNTVVVNSSFTNDTRIFSHSASTDSNTVLNQDWRHKVNEQLQSTRFRYWVFISSKDWIITLIIRNNVDAESKYLNLSCLSEGKFGLAMSPELITLLHQSTEDKKDGSIPFRLNVLND
jgi:hypothetical protein